MDGSITQAETPWPSKALAAIERDHAMPAEPDTAPPVQTGFRFPSAFTILFALIILVAALSWIIPAGLYDRVPSEALGKDVPVAGSYALTPGMQNASGQRCCMPPGR